jgi:hypothetical protein
MKRMALSAFLLLAAFATSAATPRSDGAAERVQRTLAGLSAGEPQRCLSQYKVNETRGAEGVILYVAGKHRVWRNDVVGAGCDIGLRRGDVIITESTSGAYCRGDIVRTRSAIGGGARGSCSLGDFVPYTK